MTCTLDCDGQLTLMLCTNTGHSARQDLGTIGKITAQLCGILIIDLANFIYAERAYFFALTSSITIHYGILLL